MTIHAFTDGASRGNPGESGIGVILQSEAGTVLCEGSGYIGTATNNMAEYQALMTCLRKAQDLSCSRLVVHSDSELMVRQLQGTYRVKEKTLQEYFRQVRAMLKEAPFSFEIVHIPRERNRDADRLANQGIDSKTALTL